jgi:hypothetical protein
MIFRKNLPTLAQEEELNAHEIIPKRMKIGNIVSP